MLKKKRLINQPASFWSVGKKEKLDNCEKKEQTGEELNRAITVEI
jgi:hypothetical protein